MGNPRAVIGHPDAAAEQRAQQIARSLDSPRRGRREHALQTLAELWFPISSCFGNPPHALPTPELLERVAARVREEREDTARIAALTATRAGWQAFQYMAAGDGADPARWQIPPASIAAVGDALRGGSRLVRVAAARVLAEAPCTELAADLTRALDDEVWTVRWCAAKALADLGHTENLVEVLQRSVPRTAMAGHDFYRAARALGERGAPLLQLAPPEGTP